MSNRYLIYLPGTQFERRQPETCIRGVVLACLCMIALMLTASTAKSQARTTTMPLEIVIWEREKREVVYDLLDITQAEAGAFWTIYEQYEATRRALFNERLHLAAEHAALGTTRENRQHMLTKKMLLNGVNYKRICRDYYRRLKPVIAARRASRFIQMELYFQSRLNARMDTLTHLAPAAASR
ncbi:hypothetical protein KK083_21705 [Fulvivirgaceae bacterium PWU4]|uniref:Uncharacterized protein n=1 Tax=Chryseosolibacter histidini TaxID=2782349 RepID=A0AAP2DQ58_9BACT|nr:hypothetical protein [Chryseosolibacter histidini]MBT1699529.1 hypothetical protein [Chryseosolibacter histidini]